MLGFLVVLFGILIAGIVMLHSQQRKSVWYTDTNQEIELYRTCMTIATKNLPPNSKFDLKGVVDSCQQWAYSSSSGYYCTRNCSPSDEPHPLGIKE